MSWESSLPTNNFFLHSTICPLHYDLCRKEAAALATPLSRATASETYPLISCHIIITDGHFMLH